MSDPTTPPRGKECDAIPSFAKTGELDDEAFVSLCHELARLSCAERLRLNDRGVRGATKLRQAFGAYKT